jgi:hypothetical protein
MALCGLGCSASKNDDLSSDAGMDAGAVGGDAAAGSQHDAAHAHDAANGADAGAPTEAGPGDASLPVDANTSDASVMAIQAPLIDVIMPLSPDAGVVGIHLGWDPQGETCDQFVGERKDALDPYTTWFTVQGTITTYDDTTPMKVGVNYTYRIRCKKGSRYSPYSNEESASGYN